jgi:hypothetical protein
MLLVFPRVQVQRTRAILATVWLKDFLTHGKQDLCRAFFICCTPYKKHTANKTFAMRLK